MIKLEGEADGVTTVEITELALDHIKGTERWLGFIQGVLVAVSLAAVLYWLGT